MAIMILVTIPKEHAEKLSKIILERKACACVNIISGVQSLFWWQGKIDSCNESLLLIKTKDSQFSKVEKIVKDNHPYEVPEIIAFGMDKINKNYLKWLEGEVSD